MTIQAYDVPNPGRGAVVAPRRAARARMAVALSIVLWSLGSGTAHAANALIVAAASGGFGVYPEVVANLTAQLTSAGYAVTAANAVPPSLATYGLVWDVRFDVALSVPDRTTYTAYLAGGGTLLLTGENPPFAVLRDPSLVSFAAALGGGTLNPVSASPNETVLAPFTLPNAVSAIQWQGSGQSSTPGNGTFVTKNLAGGSAILFAPGTLSTAPAGTMFVVFNVSLHLNGALPAEVAVAKNLIAYVVAQAAIVVPVPVPTPAPTPAPPTAPTGFAPTITSIANQLVGVNSSTAVRFAVGGSVIPDALRVAVSSSNPTFVQTLTLTRLDASGHWTLQVFTQDGRFGSAVITVTVSDPSGNTASTGFTVTTAGATGGPGGAAAVPTAPGNLVASSSGSGVALTWSPPDSGMPGKYIVSGGSAPGGSDVTVFVTPDAATSYVIPMIPPGTYYFRVRAATDALGPSSNEASVVAGGSPVVMGVPTGVLSTVSGEEITVTWNAPLGPAPPLYIVEFGTSDGGSEVALVTAVNPTHTRRVRAGYYFMRLRSYNGGRPSGPSNETSIPMGLEGCAAPPFVPVLLPVMVSARVVTLSWLPPDSWTPAGATAADGYRIDLTSASGAVISVASAGAGTSATWTGAAGSYSARVTALNRCGSSAASGPVSFAQP